MKKLPLILFLLLFTIPASAQWVKINSLTASTVRELKYEAGVFYAGSNGGIWRSSDGGGTWTNISSGLSGEELHTYEILVMDTAIYVASEEGVYKTTNSGANWESRSAGIAIGPGATRRFCYSIIQYNGALYCGAFAGMYKSTNDGDSWTLSGIPGPHSDVEEMFIYNGDLWAGITNTTISTLQRTTNNGANWASVQWFGPNPGGPEVFGFLAAPGDKLFIGTGHGVYFTTDNGSNWTQRNNGLGSDPYIGSLVQRGNTLIGSGKFGARGIFVTTNEGILWDTVNTGLPFMSDTYKLLIAGDTLYLAASNGVYKRPLSEVVTNVSQTSSNIPDKFTLRQNFPNPFNPSTNIKFGIPQSGLVSLKIYDITGREIYTLISTSLAPGEYTYSFNASELSSGIYFYTLKTHSFSKTMKMILLK